MWIDENVSRLSQLSARRPTAVLTSTGARRGNAARERLALWGTSLSRSDREPAVGPACGRGVPPSTPWLGGTTHLAPPGSPAPGSHAPR